MCGMTAALVLGLAIAGAQAQSPAPVHPGLQAFAPSATAEIEEWARKVAAMIRRGDLKLTSEQVSADGAVRDQWYEQRYKGVPVAGTEVWRRLDHRKAVAIDGTIYTGIDLNPVPKLTRDEAAEKATAASGATLGPSLPPELRILPLPDGTYRLVYQARVFSGAALTTYAIDASTGEIVSTDVAADGAPQ
jgi:Zn-dependent metalloprotease